MAQIWDPRAVLDLNPEIKGFKCSGTTKKGNRCCQTFLTNANKAQAGQIIRLLSTRDIVTHGVDEGVIDQFRNLAGCTLCPRWHIGDQAQVNKTVVKFRQAAERYVAEARAQGVRVHAPDGRLPAREVPARAAQQHQEYLRQADAQVQRRAQPVDRPAPQARQVPVPVARARPAFVPPVGAQAQQGPPRRQVPVQPQALVPAPPRPQPNQEQAELEERFLASFGWPFQRDPATARLLLAQQQEAQQEHERAIARIRAERAAPQRPAANVGARPVNRPAPPGAPAPAPRPAINVQQPPARNPYPYGFPPVAPRPVLAARAPRPYGPPAPAVAPRAPRPYGPAVPRIVQRRPIDEDKECYICMDPINRPEDAVWCKGECGKNLHLRCFTEWASGKGRDQVTCGHW
ncbi:hypothetical protein BDZ45DRAFT_740100 [Acephala macrosclerotiorum]|nr:hypothetical protein BDZ45DRAFT_740100 [Acephala macrosclerotiorum]